MRRSHMPHGKFIVVDGLEGGGKTTNIEILARHIKERFGAEALITREPGGTPMAEKIRDVFKSHTDEHVHYKTELLLVFAARCQHIENLIKPALARGKWVICDRFSSASFAYQGYGRGAPLAMLKTLRDTVQGSFEPDLTMILDLDPAIGLARARGRGELDRIELCALDFFERARAGFLDLARQSPHAYRVVSAEGPLDEVSRDVIAAFDKWWAAQNNPSLTPSC